MLMMHSWRCFKNVLRLTLLKKCHIYFVKYCTRIPVRHTYIVKEVKTNNRLVLSLTYHPFLKNFQNSLNEAHILLTHNKEYRKVFGDKPLMTDWRKHKSLKDHLVSAKFKCESSDNKSAPCSRFRSKFVLLLRKLTLFKTKIKVKHLTLEKGFLSYRSNLVVYWIEWKSRSKQCVVNTITPFRSRFNNYKSGTTKLSKVYPEKFNVYQKQFHRHFNSEEHNGMKDWKITIIDRAEKC